MLSRSSPAVRRRFRKGISTVEFAITLPVLAMIVFGSIEAAHSIQIKQGLTITAYEAAMHATSTGVNETQARQRAEAIADAFQINDLEVSFSPAITSDLKSGTTVTVTVSAPLSSNRAGPSYFFVNGSLEVQATMVRL